MPAQSKVSKTLLPHHSAPRPGSECSLRPAWFNGAPKIKSKSQIKSGHGQMWEILWLGGSPQNLFRLVFAQVFHEGERDTRQLTSNDNQGLSRFQASGQIAFIERFPSV